MFLNMFILIEEEFTLFTNKMIICFTIILLIFFVYLEDNLFVVYDSYCINKLCMKMATIIYLVLCCNFIKFGFDSNFYVSYIKRTK